MEKKTTIEDAYDAGWRDAVRLYAIWNDGSQWVGVMRQPLNKVLDEGPPVNQKGVSLDTLEIVSQEESC
jgi:hypothetical protein